MFTLERSNEAGFFHAVFSTEYVHHNFLVTDHGDVHFYGFSLFLTQSVVAVQRHPPFEPLHLSLGKQATAFLSHADILPFMEWHRQVMGVGLTPTLSQLGPFFPSYLLQALRSTSTPPTLPLILDDDLPRIPFIELPYGIEDQEIDNTCGYDSMLLLVYYLCTPYPDIMKTLASECPELHQALTMMKAGDVAGGRLAFAKWWGLDLSVGGTWACLVMEALEVVFRTSLFRLQQKWEAPCDLCQRVASFAAHHIKVHEVSLIPSVLDTLYRETRMRSVYCNVCPDGFQSAPLTLQASPFIVFEVFESKQTCQLTDIPAQFKFPHPRHGTEYTLKAVLIGSYKDGHIAVILKPDLMQFSLTSRFPRCDWYLFDSYKLEGRVKPLLTGKLPPTHHSYMVSALVYAKSP